LRQYVTYAFVRYKVPSSEGFLRPQSRGTTTEN